MWPSSPEVLPGRLLTQRQRGVAAGEWARTDGAAAQLASLSNLGATEATRPFPPRLPVKNRSRLPVAEMAKVGDRRSTVGELASDSPRLPPQKLLLVVSLLGNRRRSRKKIDEVGFLKLRSLYDSNTTAADCRYPGQPVPTRTHLSRSAVESISNMSVRFPEEAGNPTDRPTSSGRELHLSWQRGTTDHQRQLDQRGLYSPQMWKRGGGEGKKPPASVPLSREESTPVSVTIIATSPGRLPVRASNGGCSLSATPVQPRCGSMDVGDRRGILEELQLSFVSL